MHVIKAEKNINHELTQCFKDFQLYVLILYSRREVQSLKKLEEKNKC